MRILVNFEAGRVADHLHQIAWEIEEGRTFGPGWCLSLGGTCSFPPVTRQACPCEGDTDLCRQLHPTDRTEGLLR
jgi:hypothetical protein